MKISIRKFKESDIEKKVEWINNPLNNAYLHYDLPLKTEKTKLWFKKIKYDINRYDAVVEVDGIPCGLLGLLNIDKVNKKAEYYIAMGETDYKGKGVAKQASKLLLEYAFNELKLNRIYLYTETGNIAAQRLFEKLGFVCEGKIVNDLYFQGKYIDRYIYAIYQNGYRDDFNKKLMNTPIQCLGEFENNQLYIKREDFVPFSFGGNKARKAQLFFEDIKKLNCDCVVTYGSGSSNHCRIIANLAASKKMKCYIISPENTDSNTFNTELIKLYKAQISFCPLNEVSSTIKKTMQTLREEGKTPYFIMGGGHGSLGTQAYVNCYEEIRRYEAESGTQFDYIFVASGTGTTQAGLVAGMLLNKVPKKIIGISIARNIQKGKGIIIDSVENYFSDQNISFSRKEIEENTFFVDKYIVGGYGNSNVAIKNTINQIMVQYGIPLDETYTGKAFWGMKEYLKENLIDKKNILFIHTGGGPLFFDYIQKNKELL